MSPEAQRIAITEACGWRAELWNAGGWCCYDPNRNRQGFAGMREATFLEHSPDYLTDLNAMHEALAQATFDRSQMQAFLVHLKNQVGPTLESSEMLLFWVMMNATAAQRAEAFLRTLGKWEDGK